MLQSWGERVLVRKSAIVVAALATLMLVPAPAWATRVRELGLADMARRAERIFLGECVERRVGQDGQGRPFTEYVFDVHRAIKGVPGSQVVFTVAATPDGRGYLGLPVFEVGERALLLLYPEGRGGRTVPMGLDQGRFRLLLGRDGELLAVNGRGNERLFGDVPAELLERQGLAGRSGGALSLETLESLLGTLAEGGRP